MADQEIHMSMSLGVSCLVLAAWMIPTEGWYVCHSVTSGWTIFIWMFSVLFMIISCCSFIFIVILNLHYTSKEGRQNGQPSLFLMSTWTLNPINGRSNFKRLTKNGTWMDKSGSSLPYSFTTTSTHPSYGMSSPVTADTFRGSSGKYLRSSRHGQEGLHWLLCPVRQ